MAGQWPRERTMRELFENMGLRDDLAGDDWRARLEAARRRTLQTRHPDQVQRRAQVNGITNSNQLDAIRKWSEDRFARLSAWFQAGLPDPARTRVDVFPNPATHYAEWVAAQGHNYAVERSRARMEAMGREEAAARGAAAHAAERNAARAAREAARGGVENASAREAEIRELEREVERLNAHATALHIASVRAGSESAAALRARQDWAGARWRLGQLRMSPQERLEDEARRQAMPHSRVAMAQKKRNQGKSREDAQRERVKDMTRQELRNFTAHSRDWAKQRGQAMLWNKAVRRMRRESITQEASPARARSRSRSR